MDEYPIIRFLEDCPEIKTEGGGEDIGGFDEASISSMSFDASDSKITNEFDDYVDFSTEKNPVDISSRPAGHFKEFVDGESGSSFAELGYLECFQQNMSEASVDNSEHVDDDVTRVQESSPFICGICNCSVDSLQALIPHMASHAVVQDEEKEDSVRSVERSRKENSIIVAQNSIIAAGKRFVCDMCSAWFSETEHLSEHIAAVHFMYEAIRCNICHKSFTDEKALQQHMVVHAFICDVCHKRLPNQYSLQIHLMLHTEKKPRNLCRKTFPRSQSRHFAVPVVRKEDYSCGVCKKRYLTIGNLKRHLKTHSQEKVFECPLCPQRFTAKTNQKTHLKLHTGVRPYKCKYCKKSFTLKANLHRHILSHTGEKPFACPRCPKRFAEKATLRKHQGFHTNEKAYTCTVCGKNLSELGSLKRHINMHKGKLPYKCIVCGKGFVYAVSLKNHMVIHSGDKPFRCDVCGKCFTYKGNLKQHKVSIHLGINHRLYKSISKEERRKTLEEVEGELIL